MNCPTLLFVLGLVAAVGCTPSTPVCRDGKAVVGRIGESEVTCEAFAKALVAQQGPAFFGRYVDTHLVELEARRVGVSVDEKTVSRALEAEVKETIAQRFKGDRAGFEAQLTKYGMTIEAWRRSRFADKNADLLIEALLRQRGSLPAAREAFENRYGKDGRRLLLRHILIGTQIAASGFYDRKTFDGERAQIEAAARETAKGLQKRLAAGESFESLARTSSDEQSRGLELEPSGASRFGEAFEAAVQAQRPGAPASVVSSPKGAHVLYVPGVRRFAHYQGARLFISAQGGNAGTEGKAGSEGTAGSEGKASALKRARDARALIIAGRPFGEVAAELTDDLATRPRNGDLGAFETGRLGGEVDLVLETLPLETVSEPIATPTGYELVLLHARELDPARDTKRVWHLFISTEYARVKARRLEGRIESLAENAAKALLTELQNGADFEVLARERSEDDLTKRKGGELTGYRSGQLGPVFDAAIARMKPMELELVRSDRGFHVVRLDAVVETSFDKVKAELLGEVSTRPITPGDIKRFLDELRAQTVVEADL